MKRLESADVTGTVSLAIGSNDLGLIQFNSAATIDQALRINLVVAMCEGEIVAMQDFRRHARARRAASIAA